MGERLLDVLSHTYVWAAGLAVAAALALSWALRGAPIGQAAREEPDEEAPTAAHRDRVVGLAVFGMLTVAGGALVAIAGGILWSLPPLAIGFGTIVALIRANRRYRHASPSLRRVVDAADTAMTTSLLAGILVIGNVLAFHYGGRALDFTQERVFSLAPMTVNQLRALDRPVTFTVVLGQGDAAKRASVEQLLELFRAENRSRITVERLDPYRDPARLDDLRKLAPELAVTQGGGVLVELGAGDSAERAVIPNAELFEARRSGGAGGEPDRVVATFRGEDALIAALNRLREGKRSRVAFLTGHGEPSIHDLDPYRPGLGLLRSRLEGFGVQVVVNNLVREPIAPGTELAILAGPRTKFQPTELERLRDYVERGGRLLILLGPARDPSEGTGLEDWLKAYDVAVGPGKVLDRRYCYDGKINLILAVNLRDVHHPIVESLANRPVCLQDATPVRPAPRPGNAKVAVTTILHSSPESWVRTDLTSRLPRRREQEADGPVDLAVAVADRADTPGATGAPRLVVIGSQDAADNPYSVLNFDLILNSINWLRGRPDQQGSIPHKSRSAVVLAADPALRAKIVLVPTLLAVSTILALGITVFLSRRD